MMRPGSRYDEEELAAGITPLGWVVIAIVFFWVAVVFMAFAGGMWFLGRFCFHLVEGLLCLDSLTILPLW